MARVPGPGNIPKLEPFHNCRSLPLKKSARHLEDPDMPWTEGILRYSFFALRHRRNGSNSAVVGSQFVADSQTNAQLQLRR
jgi:hypothetical protein